LRSAIAIFLAASVTGAWAQTDTTQHGWPVVPFFATHPITGTFCEFRNTLSSDHFHNGVDIPKADGSPVYSVYNGVITSIGTTASSGTSAFVRVRYLLSGLTKTDADVHIDPYPLLHVGDSVWAHQTVLGTILPGLGHVHFTHGSSSSEMNALRNNGGFSAYADIYPPKIVTVRLFVDATEREFTDGRVSGLVDIRVYARDINAGNPADASSSTTNNAIYLIGYKILSADRDSVVYEPPSAGVRFRFDRKPNDNYVHSTYATGADLSTPIYTITNGNGADEVNSTRSVPNNAWDTRSLPVGPYTVMVFAADTRGLADTEYVSLNVERNDVLPPVAPVLQSVLNDSTNRISLTWLPNPDPDLKGYRLFFSIDGNTWAQRENESWLTRTSTSVVYNNITSGTVFFRLVAIDSAAPSNTSPPSDVYGFRLNSSSEKTLIVDGFDRVGGSGSFQESSHAFAMTHGQSVPTDFSTCSNEAVASGSIDLSKYSTVVWVLGDESTSDETFSATEQTLVAEYLRQGGRLVVSGSEIAYDLDQTSGSTDPDRTFLRDYLKVAYAADDAEEYTVIGTPGGACNGMSFRYGVLAEGAPYDEDWPDVVVPAGGSEPLLQYGATGGVGVAAVGYRGLFPGGSLSGGVVTIAFPFETILQKEHRDTLMARLYQFFGGVTAVTPGPVVHGIPLKTALHQNYPNPFNPSTQIRYDVADGGHLSLRVYDAIGREVAVLVDDDVAAGTHTVSWDARNVASGVDVYRLTTGRTTNPRTLMVL